MTRKHRVFVHALCVCLLLFVTPTGAAQEATAAVAVNDALRIRIHGKTVLGEADLQNMQFADAAAGMAVFKRNGVTLARNASVQLTVETIDLRGRITDVTSHAATTYQSLAPSRLSVSATGLVTAAPAADGRGRRRGGPGGAGSSAVVGMEQDIFQTRAVTYWPSRASTDTVRDSPR